MPAKPEEFEDLTHDLNNELTVIMGYGWMLKNLPHNQETPADAVQEIARAGDRASAIVRRLLAARPQPLLVKAKGPIRRTVKILGRRLLRNPLAGLPTEEGEDGVPQARAVFARKLSDKLRGKKKGKTAGDEYENGAPLPMDDFGGDELM